MIRGRALSIAAAVTAAVAVAGCGHSGSKGGKNGLAEALSYMPKDAPVVVAIQTDPNGSQWKQVNKLLAHVPFSGQLKQGIQSGLQRDGLDFSSDVKPLLGNEVVVTVPSVAALNAAGSTPGLAAIKVKDPAKANALLARRGTKLSPVAGADVYRTRSGKFTAVKDGDLLTADSRPLLTQALQRHSGGDSAHMTQSDFDRLVSGANENGLVVAGADLQQIMAGSPKTAVARRIKWVGALRTVGGDLTAEPDGVAVHFAVRTASGLSGADLPLAAGAASPKLVRRPAEVSFGIRDLAQTVTFAEAATQLTDPKGFAHFKSQEKQANAQLGIDVEKDLVQQATGDSSVSIGLDNSYAVRAVPRDPRAARATLAKIAPKLKKLGVPGLRSVSRGPAGLYVLTSTTGRKTYFGMIGNVEVAASDPARAQQVAQQSASAVPGAKGSFAMAFDMRSLANAVIDKQGAPAAAKLFTGTLGDFIGSVESETSGLTGSFKLQLR